MIEVITKSSDETILFGEKLVKNLPKGINVILLEGDLSSGKTTLTKGIAKGLKIKEIVNSPTFTILKTYHGLKTLHHLDLYRLDDIGSDFDLLDYILDDESIVVIEWPNKVSELIPNKYIKIELTNIDLNTRKLKLSIRE